MKAAAALASSLAVAAPGSGLAALKDGDIPYTRYTLDNGLTLIVHTDRKAPLVAVNVWYHVGSKNERPGKTGFAHLFEHLMFNGSEHFNDDFFKATERLGATDLNGTTSRDRTNYFATAPREALDCLLWLESDRMGHLLGAIDQARLDEQRGVVQNEKRQGDNQPYALAYRLITQNTWPAGHPYGWQVIGSMEDLEAASLADVREWFNAYYGAANATLVVAGDVDPEAVLASVRRHFGSIPPGPPVARHKAWVAKRSGTQRQRAEDRVPQARLYKVWNIPGYGTPEGHRLEQVAAVLADGKTSRLYKRLVYDERLATDVSAWAGLGEIAGQFHITATAAPGGALEPLERALDEELARFLKDGPTAREVSRVRIQAEAGFLRGLERVGGFGGTSDLLAMNSVFLDDPGYARVWLRDLRAMTARQLRDAARAWLADGQYVLELTPYPAYAASASDVDRSRLPLPALRPEARFPAVERATLPNGLKLVLAARPGAPVVQVNLLVDAGFAADAAARPGAARLATDLLAEGTRRRGALAISEELQLLGAQFGTACSLDTCTVSLNALLDRLDASLELFADVVLHPAFPDAEFDRRQQQRLAEIAREKREPVAIGLRVLPRLLYGAGHAYGGPLTGTGTEAGVGALTPEALRRFHAAWFRPNNATLVVVGDVTRARLLPALERLFGEWEPGEVPALARGAAPAPEAPAVTLVDRPGSLQAAIFVGGVAPPKGSADDLALDAMNQVLGGAFTSRINMNLREDKHWTYGARTTLAAARGPRPFWAAVQVQADKTCAAMRELDAELRGIVGARPVTSAETERTVANQALRLAGAWETVGSVAAALGEAACFGLPDDHFQTLPERLRALTNADLAAAARRVVRPERLAWVVVGDRAALEEGLRALGFGEVRLADADGMPVAP